MHNTAAPEFFLFCCPLRTPRNAGMICRIADGFAVKKIYFQGSKAIHNPLVIKKTSRGASGFVDFEIVGDLLEVVHSFKSSDKSALIGLENMANALPLNTINEHLCRDIEKIGLLAGSENMGISDDLLALCDYIVKIPMMGKLNSHNVHVSIAIALFELRKSNGL
jgi:23S rRNA (guanosine2251-2'-O)-methyltransferase